MECELAAYNASYASSIWCDDNDDVVDIDFCWEDMVSELPIPAYDASYCSSRESLSLKLHH